MSVVLELQGVSKVYGMSPNEVYALRDIDLRVQQGELVAIMGPSGSGKSTLLTISGSLEQASKGRVMVGSDDISSLSSDARACLRRRFVGYVFQNFNLLPGLTAVENVQMPLELDGVRTSMARAAAMAALDALGISKRAGHFPDELSGGERQRVAIARAVVGDRKLLLADEPTGALDTANGEAVMRLMRDACERGLAGVIVTHNTELAAWADRRIYLRDGCIVDGLFHHINQEQELTGARL